MRAVKNNLPTPSGELRNQKALARANGTSRRAIGWVGEKAARSRRPIGPTLTSAVRRTGAQVSVTRGHMKSLR